MSSPSYPTLQDVINAATPLMQDDGGCFQWPAGPLTNNEPLEPTIKLLIRNTIRRAEDEAAVLADALAKANAVFRTLELRKDALEHNIAVYNATLVRSHLWSLPTELLINIFEHVLDGADGSPFATKHPLSCLTQACRRWRAAAIGMTRSWTLVKQANWTGIARIIVQLERVAGALLSIETNNGLDPVEDKKFLEVVATRRSQWRDATLHLTNHTLVDFVHVGSLENLQQLYILLEGQSVDGYRPSMPCGSSLPKLPPLGSGCIRFPALQELELNLADPQNASYVFEMFSGVWSRLHVCILESCALQDIIPVLSSFGHTRLSLRRPEPDEDENDQPNFEPCAVSLAALEFIECEAYFIDVILSHIGSARALKALGITARIGQLVSPVLLSALDQSAFKLKKLELSVIYPEHYRIDATAVFRILATAPMRSVKQLSICASWTSSPDEVVTRFGRTNLLPRLTRLSLLDEHHRPVFRNRPENLSYNAVARLQKARKGVLKELVLLRWPTGCEKGTSNWEALHGLGLDVLVRGQGCYRSSCISRVFPTVAGRQSVFQGADSIHQTTHWRGLISSAKAFGRPCLFPVFLLSLSPPTTLIFSAAMLAELEAPIRPFASRAGSSIRSFNPRGGTDRGTSSSPPSIGGDSTRRKTFGLPSILGRRGKAAPIPLPLDSAALKHNLQSLEHHQFGSSEAHDPARRPAAPRCVSD
uniref:F-box domain-containing protein n=1 Tax=Mycena chlorophos TaxID=658473 RepID=A0ABQ0LWS9_MYCCL|nr:predicted protein [Mycena chlorophos]